MCAYRDNKDNTVWHTKLIVTMDAVKVLTSLCLPHLCREDRVRRSDRHAVKYSGLGTINHPYTFKATPIDERYQADSLCHAFCFAKDTERGKETSIQ